MNGTFHYSMAGQVLEVRTDRASLLSGIDGALTGLRLPEAETPDFRIDIADVETLAEDFAGATVFDGEVPDDGACRMVQQDDLTHLIFTDDQTLTLDSAERRATIQVLPDRRLKWTIWMMALDAALEAGGQHMLHTAGLTLPGSNGLVLIHAPSGTGKTTTSLALASQGFGLAADDSMIVRQAGEGIEAWGLPRHVKIHMKTAEMIPLVRQCLGERWDRNGEQAVDLVRIGEVIKVEPTAPRPVRALVHLARSGDGESRLQEMSKPEAMVALAADNVRTGLTGLLPSQRRRFAAIANLVSAVPTYRLEVGRMPTDAAKPILAALS